MSSHYVSQIIRVKEYAYLACCPRGGLRAQTFGLNPEYTPKKMQKRKFYWQTLPKLRSAGLMVQSSHEWGWLLDQEGSRNIQQEFNTRSIGWLSPAGSRMKIELGLFDQKGSRSIWQELKTQGIGQVSLFGSLMGTVVHGGKLLQEQRRYHCCSSEGKVRHRNAPPMGAEGIFTDAAVKERLDRETALQQEWRGCRCSSTAVKELS